MCWRYADAGPSVRLVARRGSEAPHRRDRVSRNTIQLFARLRVVCHDAAAAHSRARLDGNVVDDDAADAEQRVGRDAGMPGDQGSRRKPRPGLDDDAVADVDEAADLDVVLDHRMAEHPAT